MSDKSEGPEIFLKPHVWCQSELGENKKLLAEVVSQISFSVSKLLERTLVCHSCIDSYYEARGDLPDAAKEKLYTYNLKRTQRLLARDKGFVLYEVLVHNYSVLGDGKILEAVYARINEICYCDFPAKNITVGLLLLTLSEDQIVKEFFRETVAGLGDAGDIYGVPMLEDWSLVYGIVVKALDVAEHMLDYGAVARVIDLLYAYFMVRGPMAPEEAEELVKRCLNTLRDVEDKFLAFKLCFAYSRSNMSVEHFRDVFNATLNERYDLFAFYDQAPARPTSVILYPAVYIYIDSMRDFIYIGKEQEYLRVLGGLRNPGVIGDCVVAIAANIFKMRESISVMISYTHTTELFEYLVRQPYRYSIFKKLIFETLSLQRAKERVSNFTLVIDKWNRFFIALRVNHARKFDVDCFLRIVDLFVFNPENPASRINHMITGLRHSFTQLCKLKGVKELRSDPFVSRIFFWGSEILQVAVLDNPSKNGDPKALSGVIKPVCQTIFNRVYRYYTAHERHIPYFFEFLELVGQSPYTDCALNYLIVFYKFGKQLELIRRSMLEICMQEGVVMGKNLHAGISSLIDSDQELVPLAHLIIEPSHVEPAKTNAPEKVAALEKEYATEKTVVPEKTYVAEKTVVSEKKIVIEEAVVPEKKTVIEETPVRKKIKIPEKTTVPVRLSDNIEDEAESETSDAIELPKGVRPPDCLASYRCLPVEVKYRIRTTPNTSGESDKDRCNRNNMKKLLATFEQSPPQPVFLPQLKTPEILKKYCIGLLPFREYSLMESALKEKGVPEWKAGLGESLLSNTDMILPSVFEVGKLYYFKDSSNTCCLAYCFKNVGTTSVFVAVNRLKDKAVYIVQLQSMDKYLFDREVISGKPSVRLLNILAKSSRNPCFFGERTGNKFIRKGLDTTLIQDIGRFNRKKYSVHLVIGPSRSLATRKGREGLRDIVSYGTLNTNLAKNVRFLEFVGNTVPEDKVDVLVVHVNEVKSWFDIYRVCFYASKKIVFVRNWQDICP